VIDSLLLSLVEWSYLNSTEMLKSLLQMSCICPRPVPTARPHLDHFLWTDHEERVCFGPWHCCRTCVISFLTSSFEPVVEIHCLVVLSRGRCWAAIRLSRHPEPSGHAPLGSLLVGHWRTTWSMICSSEPRSQAGEGAIPHLCKQERGNVHHRCGGG